MGHPALVSDMIEEFRAIVVDTVVLNLVFNRRLQPGDFSRPSGSGRACLLDDRARKMFIRELEKKMNSRLNHPVSGLRLDYRRCMEHQVHLLAAVIQGREPRYRAMVLR
jgi:CRISPR-associated protein Cas1